MKTHNLLSTAIACLIASPISFAATADEHASHHPDQAASAPAKSATAAKTTQSAAPKKAAQPAAPSAAAAQIDQQLKAMRDMHDKMMNAKTPDERRALMGEQMKTMQDGMAMMNQMMPMGGEMKAPAAAASSASASGMSGMPGMGGMMGKSGMGDMHQHHDLMMKHMEMTQMMMQMMMDRMAIDSAK